VDKKDIEEKLKELDIENFTISENGEIRFEEKDNKNCCVKIFVKYKQISAEL
jgi:hypothetical protein